MRKILTFIFIAILIPATSAFSGDSTSLAPQSAPQGSDYYTQGGNIYTGGGDVREVDQLFADRIYATGSGSWINYYDHVNMNNRVIYDVRRMRVNEYNPSYYKDVASKWYVDQKSGSFEWPKVPSGTHCGVYMMTQSRLYAYEPCMGHNPRYSCPAGFKRADLGYFEAGGGDRKYAFCIKN